MHFDNEQWNEHTCVCVCYVQISVIGFCRQSEYSYLFSRWTEYTKLSINYVHELELLVVAVDLACDAVDALVLVWVIG